MRGRPFLYPCRSLLLSLLLLPVVFLNAQNLKCLTIPSNQQVRLDTIAIESGSVTSTSEFEFDETTRLIRVKSTADSAKVCYRVLSPLITEPFMNRDISGYDSFAGGSETPIAGSPIQKEELFEFGSIEKYGAITRGVSFGNSQSVFVNSSLNLQMNGQLADNLYVSAVITDQNIPYQPEGNTQQIRDFDNVFIKLYNDRTAVTAGDVVMNNMVPEDYFLRYYKNVQGLQFSYANMDKKWKHSTTLSGASAKGKFASILVQSIEGLTGPYKLRGPNGERFIIVLANSERVFLDGRLMTRGFDKDYTIDYNLGEITFNNHIVITRFSRIRVDFEYAEQFYSRSAFSGSQQVENDGIKIYSGFYREKDNPNSNFGFSPNKDDLDLLQSIGDQTDEAFITGFDSVSFDPNRILYRRTDTLDIDGNSVSVFVNSTDPNEQLFPVTFSDVGEGNGDYILLGNTSNGRTYEWVSPQNGGRQGRYQPGLFIPLPNSRQLINVGTEVKVSEYETVFSEAAFSSTDQNLYSTLDDNNNTGLGYYGGFRTAGRSSFIKDYKWSASVRMEYDTRNFSPIDRYRYIEFDRDWDLDRDTLRGVEDLIVWAEVSLQKSPSNLFSYEGSHRKREEMMEGWKHALRFDREAGDLRLISSHSLLTNNQGTDLSSRWLRSRSDVSYRKFRVVPGYVFEVDENELKKQDSVINSRMNFNSHEFYLTSGDSSKSTLRASYNLRKDRIPIEGRLEDFIRSRNAALNYSRSGSQSNLSLDLNYRSVDNLQNENMQEEDIVSGRVNWWGQYLKKSLTQTFSFATGNSRELQREFVFLPVSTGDGTHTWRDLNEDGIQDLNEFFEAINPDERNYIKIFTPTDEYITSFQTFYVHTIDIRSPRSWRNQGGFRTVLSRFSGNLNFNINYRTTSESFNSRLNPFSPDPDDTDLLSARDQKRYTLFFNRNGRGFAADMTWQTGNNKQLLTQGFELRQRRDFLSNFKTRLNDEYTFRLSTTLGEQSNRSDFLSSRNFRIISNVLEPQLIWQPSNAVRIIGSYEREDNDNQLTESSGESSLIQKYKGELTWNQTGKGSLRASFAWVNIDFEGDPSTYLGYLLLDALQPGINQTWQVNWQQKLSRGMQLTLLYNGRKSENSGAIHTGNVQVTAFF